MIKYRFTKKEVDEMSFNIRTHTDNEKSEAKSAWRLRLLLEGLAYCCEYNKKGKGEKVAPPGFVRKTHKKRFIDNPNNYLKQLEL